MIFLTFLSLSTSAISFLCSCVRSGASFNSNGGLFVPWSSLRAATNFDNSSWSCCFFCQERNPGVFGLKYKFKLKVQQFTEYTAQVFFHTCDQDIPFEGSPPSMGINKITKVYLPSVHIFIFYFSNRCCYIIYVTNQLHDALYLEKSIITLSMNYLCQWTHRVITTFAKVTHWHLP